MLEFCIWQVHLQQQPWEVARYKLDVVDVQEVRLDKGGMVRAGDHNFFYGKRNENHWFGTGFFYITESYQQLRE
jgi:hypothetical protein